MILDQLFTDIEIFVMNLYQVKRLIAVKLKELKIYVSLLNKLDRFKKTDRLFIFDRGAVFVSRCCNEQISMFYRMAESYF
jgi:hypothetical protein